MISDLIKSKVKVKAKPEERTFYFYVLRCSGPDTGSSQHLDLLHRQQMGEAKAATAVLSFGRKKSKVACWIGKSGSRAPPTWQVLPWRSQTQSG
jgi:hypothetical protein